MAILAGFNCKQMLSALITMIVLYAADGIFIIVAYEAHKHRSLPMNVIAIVIMVVVPILAAAICLWWCKPGPPEQDVPTPASAESPRGPVNSPASSSTTSHTGSISSRAGELHRILVPITGVFLIFVLLLFLIFYI